MPPCPGCGANRPVKSLLVCRTCWAKLPNDMKLETYKAAMENRPSVLIGDKALEVLVLLAKMRFPPMKAS